MKLWRKFNSGDMHTKVPPELHKKIKSMAAAMAIPVGTLVELVLTLYLEDYEMMGRVAQAAVRHKNSKTKKTGLERLNTVVTIAALGEGNPCPD